MTETKSVRVPNIAPTRFAKETISELKKVAWPTRAEVAKLTTMVIVLSAAVGAFIGALDYILIAITSMAFKG